MGCLHQKSSALIAVFGLILLLADYASAQRRGGFFPVSRIQLASLMEVQSDLKLTDAQKSTVATLYEKLLAILNDEQNESFNKLMGKEIEIDLTPLYPRPN